MDFDKEFQRDMRESVYKKSRLGKLQQSIYDSVDEHLETDCEALYVRLSLLRSLDIIFKSARDNQSNHLRDSLEDVLESCGNKCTFIRLALGEMLKALQEKFPDIDDASFLKIIAESLGGLGGRRVQ